MPDLASLPLPLVWLVFAAAATVIGVAGWQLATVANQIARRTGLGQALTGAIFLGGVTSLSGTVTSVSAAATGHPELAIGNALGGIFAQTAFLAIADITYRRANLEHAAASVANIMLGALLVVMLSLVMLAMAAPRVEFFGMHPVSVLLPLVYLYGMRLVSQAHSSPMWRPQQTSETREDPPSPTRGFGGMWSLWLRLVVLGALVGVAGWFIADTSILISQATGMSETGFGAVFSAVSTSLPELVTCIAAVRQGALTLAVGDIIGGNVFDTLFVTVSDAVYRDGSILHAAAPQGMLVAALAMLITGIMLMGMVRREQSGIGNIGFESFCALLLYVAGSVLLLVA